MPVISKSFVAIDVETTGIDPQSDAIIQVGAVRFENGRVVRELNSLVRPGVHIPLKVQRMTGISEEAASAAPTFEEIAPQLLEFVGDSPLIAHNAPFDVGFIEAALGRCGEARLANRVYDTLDLARLVRPASGSHRLERLAREMNIPLRGSHDALMDAFTAGRVFLALFEDVCRLAPSLIDYISSLAGTCGWEVRDILEEAAPLAIAAAMGRPGGPREKGAVSGGQSLAGTRDGMGEEDSPGCERGGFLPVTPEYVGEVLGKQGLLSSAIESYEFRPQQLQAAYLVAEALSEGKHLLVEAGTGIGKSIAYLVPAARFASTNGERVVVSTHTINLQEQIWTRDIPLLKERLGLQFDHALLKGRSNYICLRRWRVVAGKAVGRTADEIKMIARLAVWLHQTDTGDKSELGFTGDQEAVWESVASDSASCEGQACPHASSCYFQAARSAAARADIIVVNHSLVLSDAALDNRVLPEYSHIVFDEAHNLERAASEHFGESASTRNIERLLTIASRGGLLERIGRAVTANMHESSPAGSLEALMSATRSAAGEARERLEPVASSWAGDKERPRPRPARVRGEGQEDERWAAFRERALNLSQALERAAGPLEDIARLVDELSWENDTSGNGGSLRDLAADARRTGAALASAACVISNVARAADPERVYWIEPEGDTRPQIVFRSAPIEVGPLLRQRLFDRMRSAILTSATLTVNGSFDYLKTRLGLAEEPEGSVVCESIGSPFDYAKQALVCVPSGLPTPKDGEARFTEALGASLIRLAHATRGRMLVLFTSNKMMRTVYHRIRNALESSGICLLAQGIDGSRTRLVEELRDGSETVLFGSQSFWEGVDVAGPALSCVAIVKLPFSPPDDPVTEARMEHLAKKGGNPFADLLVPEAVLKFKQGFGRLIRSREDRGAVVVFDRRVLPGCSNYGARFLDSLPGPSLVFEEEDGILERLREWLPQPGGRTSGE
ncbi:MAG: helicase C-terminal domain-containing protein [Ignavibacteriales bacterium]